MWDGDFTPVAPNIQDRVTVPQGYRSEVLIKWGDPVTRKARPFDVHKQTPESAATQFGYNNDYVGIIPNGDKRGLLVTNHEYTDENLMFPTGSYDSATIKKIAIASHGMAVVEIIRGSRRGSWTTVDHRRAKRNRRITADSPFLLFGPAAGDSRLRTSADPSGRRVRGTLETAPAVRRPGARSSPARRTSTATSTTAAPSTRATPRRTSATGSRVPAAAGTRWTRDSTWRRSRTSRSGSAGSSSSTRRTPRPRRASTRCSGG